MKKNNFNQKIGSPVNNWKPSIYPTQEKMNGQYCDVVPFDISNHAKELFNAFNINQDRSNWTYLADGPFNSFQEYSSWLKSFCLGKDPLFYTVIDSKNSEAIGLASYLRIEPTAGVIEVGNIHFSPKLQNTAMGTEAMYLMMKKVFEEWGYRRYEWKCDNYNEPSKKAAIRLGFTFEGVFRQMQITKGRNRDKWW